MPGLSLEEFSLIGEKGMKKLTVNADLREAGKLDYGCGLFRFTK